MASTRTIATMAAVTVAVMMLLQAGTTVASVARPTTYLEPADADWTLLMKSDGLVIHRFTDLLNGYDTLGDANYIAQCADYNDWGSDFVLRVTMGCARDYFRPRLTGGDGTTGSALTLAPFQSLSVCEVLSANSRTPEHSWAPTYGSTQFANLGHWPNDHAGGSAVSPQSTFPLSVRGSEFHDPRPYASFWAGGDSNSALGGCCNSDYTGTPNWAQPFEMHIARGSGVATVEKQEGDDDGDGVVNCADMCPGRDDVAADLNGDGYVDPDDCDAAPVSVAVTDSDGDGVEDNDDCWPNNADGATEGDIKFIQSLDKFVSTTCPEHPSPCADPPLLDQEAADGSHTLYYAVDGTGVECAAP